MCCAWLGVMCEDNDAMHDAASLLHGWEGVVAQRTVPCVLSIPWTTVSCCGHLLLVRL
jgi:hypothetical protein